MAEEGKMKGLLKSAGLSAQNLSAGLVIHEVIGASLLFGGWFAGYRVLCTPSGARLVQRAYAASPWLQAARHRTSEAAAHRWVERLPASWRRDADLKAAGDLNGTLARKVLSPVLVPGKIFVAVHMAKGLFPAE